MSHRALPLLALALLLGCTHWVKDETVLLAPAPEPREQFQIFTAAGTVRAHGVRSDSMSLSYVSYVLPPDCDSCRVTIPLATVDSVRTSKLSPGRNAVLGAVIITIMYLFKDYPSDDGTY